MLPETNSIQSEGYTLMSDTKDMLLSGDVQGGMKHITLGMKDIRSRYVANEWKQFAQSTFFDHPLTQLIHQCPFTYHSFVKPRGYAGDAELLDFIYGFKQPTPNLTTFGREIFDYCRGATVPSSVRARRDVLAQTIDCVASTVNHPVQILSIACGHLREIHESIAVREGNIERFIAFDQDPISLAMIDRELNSNFIQTIQGSVATLVRQKQTFENLDLVYAAGLYDYLSQPFATRLTKIMFEMLRPGGKLLVANFVPDHLEVGYMETFMQWHLIYRTENQLDDVAKEIPASEIYEKRTFFEDNGNIVFLELVKA
jgi:extracellular factor (EF) 3-hydroxypalmitic acid methyl ester biosynthesis protein